MSEKYKPSEDEIKKEPQQYRDELADKLKEIRNSDPENLEIAKAKAEGYLEASKQSDEYKEAEKDQRRHAGLNRDLGKQNKELDDLKNDPVIGFIFKERKIELVENNVQVWGDKIIYHYETSRIEKYWSGDSEEIQKEFNEELEKVKSIIQLLLDNQDRIPKSLFSGRKEHILYNVGRYRFGIQWNGSKWERLEVLYSGMGGISSLRFKEEIHPIENAVDRISHLRGVSFKWRNKNTSREMGVIAEEVYSVFPELVALDENNRPLGVYYDKFAAVLIEAVKELNQEIEKLKSNRSRET